MKDRVIENLLRLAFCQNLGSKHDFKSLIRKKQKRGKSKTKRYVCKKAENRIISLQ